MDLLSPNQPNGGKFVSSFVVGNLALFYLPAKFGLPLPPGWGAVVATLLEVQDATFG